MRKLALLLAALLALSCFAAFAEIEGPRIDNSLYPLVDEKITITMTHAYTDVMPADWSTVWFWQQLEELTNIHIEFTPVPSSDRATRLNLMFGANELPDILFKMSVSSTQQSQYGAEGMLLDLTQYLDVMPNFKYWLDAYPTARAAVTQSNGAIYGCPYILTGYAIRMGSRMFYNREVLDYAGFENPPTTLDEFYDYLSKIKDFDYNKNGIDDTIPWGFSDWNQLDYTLAGSFGLMNRGSSCYWFDQNEDGTGRFWHTAEGYKELMRYCNKLYSEGLLDPDLFTDTFAQLITKCQTGRTLTYCFVNNSPVSGAYEAQSVPMTEPLTGYNGEKMWSAYSMPASQSANFCITSKCPEEYREIMARWADYFYSVEGMVAYFMGEENVTYTYDAETDTYALTDMVLKDPNGRNFEQVQSQWCTRAGGMNPSCTTNELFKGGETWPISLESAAGLINYTPDAVGGAVWAPFVFDPDTASRISVLTADFDTYLDEWVGNFITGKKDVDNDWDEYVNGFDALGVPEYLGYIDAKIDEKGL